MSEQVLPFYLVCDESGSMHNGIIEMNNKLLPDLHQAIGTDPVVADKTRFAIIGFAEDARVLLPLCDLSMVATIPGLVSRGTTNYGDAFRLLRDEIDKDVETLKRDGNLVYRPAVFFISDGLPSQDDWRDSFANVVDPNWKYRPNIISFGIDQDDTDATIIAEIGTFKAFMIKPGVDPGKALTEFAKALTNSIVMSASTSSATGMTLQAPDHIPGFTPLTVDAL
jgi:uncharacterized protein YegL